jgi:hypothetical protein
LLTADLRTHILAEEGRLKIGKNDRGTHDGSDAGTAYA